MNLCPCSHANCPHTHEGDCCPELCPHCGAYLPGPGFSCPDCEEEERVSEVDSFPEVAGENDGSEAYEPTAADLEEMGRAFAAMRIETKPLSPLGRQLVGSLLSLGVSRERIAEAGPATAAYLGGAA